jgi:Bacterial Ig-like domain
MASDISGYGRGADPSTNQALLVTDLSEGLPAAGVATSTRLLSHTAASLTEAAPGVTLLGVSEDSRLAFFSAADATVFGNDGVAFSDAASAATDLFAVDLNSRSIELISGQNQASFGQAAAFLGLAEAGSVLYSLGNGTGISTVAGRISDPNGNGTDVLSARFNLIDLDTADDTLNADGSGTTRDNITAKRSFVLHSWATPGMAVQLRDGDSVVASQTAGSDGRLRWQLSNVAVGSHSYNLWHPAEAVPIRLASSLGSSTLTLSVSGNNSPTGAVAISGMPVVGRTLTAANTLADFDGIPSAGPDAIRYQWNADGSPIAGAIGNTFLLTAAQVGKAISVTATYKDNQGTSESVGSPPTQAVAASSPVWITDISDDTGILKGSIVAGGLTNDTTPTLVGSLATALPAGASVRVFRNDGFAGNATVTGTNWTYTPATPLTAGSHAFQVAIFSSSGTAGVVSDPRLIVLDTSAPTQVLTITAVTDDRDPGQGLIAPGGSSNDSTPAFSGTLSAALAEGEVLRLYNGSTALATAVVNNTALSWTAVLNLSSDATYTITARVEDGAGNQGPLSASRAFTLDTLAPSKTVTITTISDNVGSLQGPVPEGGSSDDTTPALNGSLSAALVSGEVLTIYSNGVSAGNATASGTTWSFTPAAPLSRTGSHAFTAAVLDGAGNRGTLSAARTFVLDAPISTEARDTLTGTTAADIFLLPQLTRSLLGSTGSFTYDTITGFQASDSIQVGALAYKLKLTSSVGVAADLSAPQLNTVLPTTFAAGAARAFTVTGLNGTFVALNDNQAGFQAAQDAIVFLLGYRISSANSVSVI